MASSVARESSSILVRFTNKYNHEDDCVRMPRSILSCSGLLRELWSDDGADGVDEERSASSSSHEIDLRIQSGLFRRMLDRELLEYAFAALEEGALTFWHVGEEIARRHELGVLALQVTYSLGDLTTRWDLTGFLSDLHALASYLSWPSTPTELDVRRLDALARETNTSTATREDLRGPFWHMWLAEMNSTMGAIEVTTKSAAREVHEVMQNRARIARLQSAKELVPLDKYFEWGARACVPSMVTMARRPWRDAVEQTSSSSSSSELGGTPPSPFEANVTPPLTMTRPWARRQVTHVLANAFEAPEALVLGTLREIFEAVPHALFEPEEPVTSRVAAPEIRPSLGAASDLAELIFVRAFTSGQTSVLEWITVVSGLSLVRVIQLIDKQVFAELEYSEHERNDCGRLAILREEFASSDLGRSIQSHASDIARRLEEAAAAETMAMDAETADAETTDTETADAETAETASDGSPHRTKTTVETKTTMTTTTTTTTTTSSSSSSSSSSMPRPDGAWSWRHDRNNVCVWSPRKDSWHWLFSTHAFDGAIVRPQAATGAAAAPEDDDSDEEAPYVHPLVHGPTLLWLSDACGARNPSSEAERRRRSGLEDDSRGGARCLDVLWQSIADTVFDWVTSDFEVLMGNLEALIRETRTAVAVANAQNAMFSAGTVDAYVKMRNLRNAICSASLFQTTLRNRVREHLIELADDWEPRVRAWFAMMRDSVASSSDPTGSSLGTRQWNRWPSAFHVQWDILSALNMSPPDPVTEVKRSLVRKGPMSWLSEVLEVLRSLVWVIDDESPPLENLGWFVRILHRWAVHVWCGRAWVLDGFLTGMANRVGSDECLGRSSMLVEATEELTRLFETSCKDPVAVRRIHEAPWFLRWVRFKTKLDLAFATNTLCADGLPNEGSMTIGTAAAGGRRFVDQFRRRCPRSPNIHYDLQVVLRSKIEWDDPRLRLRSLSVADFHLMHRKLLSFYGLRDNSVCDWLYAHCHVRAFERASQRPRFNVQQQQQQSCSDAPEVETEAARTRTIEDTWLGPWFPRSTTTKTTTTTTTTLGDTLRFLLRPVLDGELFDGMMTCDSTHGLGVGIDFEVTASSASTSTSAPASASASASSSAPASASPNFATLGDLLEALPPSSVRVQLALRRWFMLVQVLLPTPSTNALNLVTAADWESVRCLATAASSASSTSSASSAAPTTTRRWDECLTRIVDAWSTLVERSHDGWTSAQVQVAGKLASFRRLLCTCWPRDVRDRWRLYATSNGLATADESSEDPHCSEAEWVATVEPTLLGAYGLLWPPLVARMQLSDHFGVDSSLSLRSTNWAPHVTRCVNALLSDQTEPNLAHWTAFMLAEPPQVAERSPPPPSLALRMDQALVTLGFLQRHRSKIALHLDSWSAAFAKPVEFHTIKSNVARVIMTRPWSTALLRRRSDFVDYLAALVRSRGFHAIASIRDAAVLSSEGTHVVSDAKWSSIVTNSAVELALAEWIRKEDPTVADELVGALREIMPWTYIGGDPSSTRAGGGGIVVGARDDGRARNNRWFRGGAAAATAAATETATVRPTWVAPSVLVPDARQVIREREARALASFGTFTREAHVAVLRRRAATRNVKVETAAP